MIQNVVPCVTLHLVLLVESRLCRFALALSGAALLGCSCPHSCPHARRLVLCRLVADLQGIRAKTRQCTALAAANQANCTSVWPPRRAIVDAEAPAAAGIGPGAAPRASADFESKASTSSVDGLLPPVAELSAVVDFAGPAQPLAAAPAPAKRWRKPLRQGTHVTASADRAAPAPL